VRWIGGASGAGKSTVATRLAGEFGARIHHCETFAALKQVTTRVAEQLRVS